MRYNFYGSECGADGSCESASRPAGVHGGRAYQRAGFSLIEVVIAMSIFSLGAIVLVGSFSSALLARERAAVEGDSWRDALVGVRRQLLLEPNREAVEEGGDYQTLQSGLVRWESDVRETDVVDLFAVDLRIYFLDATDQETELYEETLWLLRPSFSDPEERSVLLEAKRRDFDRLKLSNF